MNSDEVNNPEVAEFYVEIAGYRIAHQIKGLNLKNVTVPEDTLAGLPDEIQFAARDIFHDHKDNLKYELTLSQLLCAIGRAVSVCRYPSDAS